MTDGPGRNAPVWRCPDGRGRDGRRCGPGRAPANCAESLLPPLHVDDRQLHGQGEFVQRRLQRKHLNELLGVSRSIGLDNQDAARGVVEFLEFRQQVLLGPAANAVAGDRPDVGALELLGVHGGILVVVDDDVGREAALLESREKFFQERGFARAEKTHQNYKRCHER